ncbi:MAG: hypothetical protein WD334_00870, partial [Chitinophagales bacterium]
MIDFSKKLGLFLGFLFVSVWTLAQSPYEALRYSETTFLGSSRGRALSGAFGALGADFTAIGINPGGVGMFRKSEFVATLGLQARSNFSGYANSETDDLRVRANIPNIGFIYTKLFVDDSGRKTKGKWTSFNFAVGINRTADFNEHRFWESKNARRSLLPALANELNGLGPNQISMGTASAEAVMGWNSYLLNPLPNDTLSYSSVTDNREITQRINSEIQGGINDISITLGANYNDRLYFGVYLGIPVLRYTENITHRELDEENAYTGFDNFRMEQELSTMGIGFNTRVGLLYRVNNYFRVGASIHSPTFYGLQDEFSGSISSDLDTTTHRYETAEGSFDYSLSTPWRFNASTAVLFGKYGFFSLDYEYVDYRKARYFLDSDYSTFENVLNESVDNIAQNASNIRAGVEFAIGMFRIRGGYAIYGSSLSGESFLGRNSGQMASGGVGFRLEKVYLDFAYNRLIYKERLNVLFNGIQSTDKVVRNMVTATVG